MKNGYYKVKGWFIDKEQAKARNYDIYFDEFLRDENGIIKRDENGYGIVLLYEILDETEKAVKAEIHSGWTVGSGKGWKTWIPKSLIGEEVSSETVDEIERNIKH